VSNYIAVDGGKSGLRLVLATGSERQYAQGAGFVYRPDDDGVEQIIASLTSALESLTMPERIDGICAGLTGVPGDEADRLRLLTRLEAIVGAPALLAEDGVLAHAGSLSGPGTVLCVGTGTVTFALGADGQHARIDGWGPQLGDRGSAYAIGLAGLRAATAALDGVGPSTSLTDALPLVLGGTDLASLQAYYRSPDNLARTAEFARRVIDAAADDAVARGICQRAAADLAAAARSACDRAALTGAERRVSYAGRALSPNNALHTELIAALGDIGLPLVEPAGSSLDGGIALLAHPGPYAALLWPQTWEGR
jgi:glucosamine kinase